MSEVATQFSLREGEIYQFNFPGAPGGRGTFLGLIDGLPGWLAFEVYDRNQDDYEVKFYNAANLNALKPESDPRV